MAATRTREAKRLAVIIRSQRLKLHLSASDVARRAGLNPSTIMRLEQGIFARPNPHSLQAIAVALELPENHLVAEAGWIPKAKPVSHKPHLRIICHNMPAEVTREIQDAVNVITERSAVKFDTYHESVKDELVSCN